MSDERPPTRWEVWNDGRAFSAWMFGEDYDPPEDRGEAEMPGAYPLENAADNVEETGVQLVDWGSEGVEYAFDVDPREPIVPSWTKYAVGGVVLLLVLVALRPYASIGARVVD